MQSVLMEKNEHLGIITLNRPKSLNAMNRFSGRISSCLRYFCRR